jgi:putative nucleotidyltransferase with HDIG domain
MRAIPAPTREAHGAPDPRLGRLLDCAARLPSPPAIVLALLASLGDENEPIDEIASHAERDQALTARLLKVANSPYFGLAGRVATVREAAMVLGLSNMRNLTLATEMLNRYPAIPGGRAGLAEFWRHGLLAAFCGAALARCCEADEGIAFTAGLLHDIGKLVLASAHPEEYPETCAHAGDPLALERARFGADHAALGGLIAERWRFPGVICNALRFHHESCAPDRQASIVAHADLLAHALAPDGVPAARLQRCADSLAALGARRTAPELLAEIEAHAAAAAELAGATR